jgi:hypothetical protein
VCLNAGLLTKAIAVYVLNFLDEIHLLQVQQIRGSVSHFRKPQFGIENIIIPSTI